MECAASGNALNRKTAGSSLSGHMHWYAVAGHAFALRSDDGEVWGLLSNYEPFAIGETAASEPFAIGEARGSRPLAFTLRIGELSAVGRLEYTEELRQEQPEDSQTIVCGRRADGRAVFEFLWRGELTGILTCSGDYREGELLTAGEHKKQAIDNALMVIYALATADQGTALFHAAAVSHAGEGYLFIAPSGTGKSTHARLWGEWIADVGLVNDDNPVVRIGEDGEAWVYGSPWSGKTACYRNERYPLRGIVLLSQAPYNRIRRLRGVEAFAALRPSISGKRWERRIADGLHATESGLTADVPVWHLECRPDREAAEMCASTITKKR